MENNGIYSITGKMYSLPKLLKSGLWEKWSGNPCSWVRFKGTNLVFNHFGNHGIRFYFADKSEYNVGSDPDCVLLDDYRKNNFLIKYCDQEVHNVVLYLPQHLRISFIKTLKEAEIKKD